MVERLGASFYPDDDASEAADTKVPTAVRDDILKRYLKRMCATAEREKAPGEVRGLYRQYFVAAGGDENSLPELLTDAQEEERGQWSAMAVEEEGLQPSQ
jgi:hypothetical protein